jgi:hypothetical protein
MLKFLNTYYSSLKGNLEQMTKYIVILDSFDDLEDIGDKDDDVINVNVSIETNGNEDQTSRIGPYTLDVTIDII